MTKHNKNKKAVEISINLVIMLIIGLTILGLIVALVTQKKGKTEIYLKIVQMNLTNKHKKS